MPQLRRMRHWVPLRLKEHARQLTTFQIPGATNERQRIEALARFGRISMGALWDVCAAKHLLMS
jgi:hypothetical protein